MSLGLKTWPDTISEFAHKVDHLYHFINAVSIFFTLLITGLVIAFAIIYRRKSDSDRPKGVHGNVFFEVLWSVIPFGIVLVMFVWGADLYFQYVKPPANSLEILVTGKQWMWKIQHPSGKREINDMHVPAGQPVRLVMTSEDVIHNLFIPAMRVKKDVVPGKYTELWFQADKVGEYHLFCAEYCGTEHSLMIGKLKVLPADEYQKWASGELIPGMAMAGTPEARGEAIFKDMGCVTCHMAGTSQLGPDLTGIFGSTVEFVDGTTAEVDENYLRESILNSSAKLLKGYQPVMPSYQGQISNEKLLYLIAYIKSLTKEEEANSTASP